MKILSQPRVWAAVAVLVTVATGTTMPVEAVSSSSSLVKGKDFDRFMVIVLENTDKDTAKSLPYLSSLAQTGVALTNFDAATHPSQPNYIAMISGSRNGVWLDLDHTVKDKPTIVDLLESKGISWKAYMQGYPGNCNLQSKIGNYVRKHNPFISFTTITSNPDRCAKIVPATQLEEDIQANNIPQFMFYSPDLQNDGHDTSPQFADNWLKSFLEPKLSNPQFMENTVILITYDEAENYFIRNQVFSVLVGGALSRKGHTDDRNYNHYSMLRTVQDNWGLGNLGQNDVSANPFVIKDSTPGNRLSERVKHVVLLVMENISFDKLAGSFRYSSEIRGLKGDEYNYCDPSDPKSPKIYATSDSTRVSPDDPDHSMTGVAMQLTGKDVDPKDLSKFVNGQQTMTGFVRAHAALYNISCSDSQRLSHVMNSFKPDEVPVTYALAENYALFDDWYCAIPGSTQPNRLYIHSATSAGETSTTGSHYIKGYPQRTLYNALSDVNISWKNYFQELPTLILFQQLRKLKYAKNYHLYKTFLEDAKSGSLPSFSVVDQSFAGLPCGIVEENDNHPPSDLARGEQLVKEIYETLRNGPQWNETLLIITYDEHGGFYDHVPPPVDGVPNPDGLSGPDFNFDRLGIRVPTIMVSPWIKKGKVVHEPKNRPEPTSKFTHSSIAATMKKVFNLPQFLTKRDEWSATFEDIFLELEQPRGDCPEKLPDAPPLTPTNKTEKGIEKAVCDALRGIVKLFS